MPTRDVFTYEDLVKARELLSTMSIPKFNPNYDVLPTGSVYNGEVSASAPTAGSTPISIPQGSNPARPAAPWTPTVDGSGRELVSWGGHPTGMTLAEFQRRERVCCVDCGQVVKDGTYLDYCPCTPIQVGDRFRLTEDSIEVICTVVGREANGEGRTLKTDGGREFHHFARFIAESPAWKRLPREEAEQVEKSDDDYRAEPFDVGGHHIWRYVKSGAAVPTSTQVTAASPQQSYPLPVLGPAGQVGHGASVWRCSSCGATSTDFTVVPHQSWCCYLKIKRAALSVDPAPAPTPPRGYPDRSEVDSLLREDARRHPEFARARMAAVLAYFDAAEVRAKKLKLSGGVDACSVRAILSVCRDYEGVRGGGRMPSRAAEDWRNRDASGISFDVLGIYEAARSRG